MIGLIFKLGNEVVETRIVGTEVYYRTSTFGSQFVPIDSVFFSKAGVIKEFPDLEGDEAWKAKALERLKSKLKSFKNEKACSDYILEEFKKMGYIPLYRQRSGFRTEVIHAS